MSEEIPLELKNKVFAVVSRNRAHLETLGGLDMVRDHLRDALTPHAGQFSSSIRVEIGFYVVVVYPSLIVEFFHRSPNSTLLRKMGE